MSLPTIHSNQEIDLSKELTIDQFLRRQAAQTPDAVAITAPGRKPLTYRELIDQVDYVAKFLSKSGLTHKDCVAIVLPNGAEMAVAFLGVSSGAISAPLNPGYREAEFDFYLSELNARALIVQSGSDSPAITVAQKRNIPVIDLSPVVDGIAGLFHLRAEQVKGSSVVRRAEPTDVALILHTSGTTSRPKMVPLTHSNLLASARNIATSLSLTSDDRCLNVMPLFHIHGLVGALLSSAMAGASVISTAGFDVEQFFPWLEAFDPTWYTAVPTIHHAVLSRAQADPKPLKIHALRFIRSSSSALPARVMLGLEELFHVPVIEAYGMTEAAHQMASNPLPPGQRKVGSVGRAAGPEVSIMDEGGNLLSTGEVGEIIIRGANVTLGYASNADSNKECFERGWFRTGDQGYIDPDGYLFITGRLKEIINRGGEKISPREVEDVILQHPAVAEAITFAMPHETLGEDAAAAVVLRNNAAVTEEELQRFVAAQLAEFKIPRRVLFVDEIPKSATGKPQRVGLAEKLGPLLSKQPIHEFLAPQTAVEKSLAAIWSKVLGVEPIGTHDNFFQLGGDSIRATQVISRVREAMQIELPILSFFETPTVTGLAECIEKTRQTEPHLQTRPTQPVTRDETLPLSFAQQRLWFLNQLEPVNPVYNRPLALRLTGKLQTQVLERCLNEIVRRHEVLRTNFQAIGGEPVQIISPSLTLDLPVIDLSHLPDGEREVEALRQAIRESKRPFDLAQGDLVRTHLYRLNDQAHLLLFVTHHIVFDGWSDGVLLGELTALYKAIIEGKPSTLPDLPMQNAEYAIWQRQQIEAKVFDKDLLYWKQQLNSSPSLLCLPTDRPRPAAQTYRGARQSFALPAVLSERLKELSRREQVTLFMTLLAALKTLLCRYTGQEDILVGVPTAGRNRIETEQLLGIFINTVVLRTDLSGDPSFLELLRRVREVALGAYAHQDLPFEKLIEVLQPARDLSRNSLFDVMFQVRNTPQQDIALPGLRAACVDLDIGVARFDLTLEVTDEGEGLECRFEYNTDLFEAATIARMANHFQTLLEGLVANPDQHVSDLPILTESERRQLLVEWNETKRDYAKDKCIHQLFEEQVERTPESVAVVFEDRQLTYRELNQRANQLAYYLAKQGVSPETLVGICAERSFEMVVGILGILKAGGAYLPLDPTYPQERTSFMLEDSHAGVLLTQEKLLAETSRLTVVCLDRDWPEIACESVRNPEVGVRSENIAYVIYTSGSTGTPKGVMVEHRSVVNYLHWFNESPLSEKPGNFPAISKPTVDALLKQLFSPLLRGHPTWLIKDDLVNQPILLFQTIGCCAPVSFNCVPSLWNVVIDAIDSNSITVAPDALSSLLLGGEAPSRQLIERTFAVFPSVDLWNLYGPTEATANAVVAKIIPHGPILIGRPIDNTQVYLLDAHLNPVPIGVSGELYIGGDGLARGYLNRPELTQEKFLRNPFSSDPKSRLYRTGDLARYLPDGNIELLGRIDHQVKIRGFRIELGEIESTLSQHPAVRESVVLAREDSGDKRLVAYVVPSHDPVPSPHDLRRFLKQKLPDYMLPTAFVFLDSLPLTPNGKVDRRVLPAPDQSRPELEERFLVARTPLEVVIARIWAEVLKLDQVGIHDNFFDLGGHSLLATQVISRVRSTLQLELPLRNLFDMPTVAGLANAIEAAKRRGGESLPPKISSVPRQLRRVQSSLQESLAGPKN